MEPGKTSFFQALGVPTKIARGTIEITTDLKLVEAGAKVGASEATLLNMLNISPFTYGMKVVQVYEEGNTFSPDVLDIEESQLLKALSSAIAAVTAISLAANYPTLPSVIHSLVNSYKKAIAVAIGTDYSWPAIDELKDRIANPDAYASAAPAAAAADDSAAAPADKEEEKEEEKEESEDEGMHKFRQNLLEILLTTPQASVVSSTKWLAPHSIFYRDTFDAVTRTFGQRMNQDDTQEQTSEMCKLSKHFCLSFPFRTCCVFAVQIPNHLTIFRYHHKPATRLVRANRNCKSEHSFWISTSNDDQFLTPRLLRSL